MWFIGVDKITPLLDIIYKCYWRLGRVSNLNWLTGRKMWLLLVMPIQVAIFQNGVVLEVSYIGVPAYSLKENFKFEFFGEPDRISKKKLFAPRAWITDQWIRIIHISHYIFFTPVGLDWESELREGSWKILSLISLRFISDEIIKHKFANGFIVFGLLSRIQFCGQLYQRSALLPPRLFALSCDVRQAFQAVWQ